LVCHRRWVQKPSTGLVVVVQHAWVSDNEEVAFEAQEKILIVNAEESQAEGIDSSWVPPFSWKKL